MSTTKRLFFAISAGGFLLIIMIMPIVTTGRRKSGVPKGVHAIMAFYMYSFNDPQSLLLHTRGKLFIETIKPLIRKELQPQVAGGG